MNATIAITLAAAAAGILDLGAATFLSLRRGMSIESLLQFVASGVLGEAAFRGGTAAALAGLLLHFLIAASWSAAYFCLGLRFPSLPRHPVVAGVLLGVVVHLTMSLVVLPLSMTPKRPFALDAWLIQLLVHVAFVGLPIALVQARWPKG